MSARIQQSAKIYLSVVAFSLILSNCQQGPSNAQPPASPSPTTSPSLPVASSSPTAPDQTDVLATALNYGLPLPFSSLKMDLKANPRQDFPRYATGIWQDRSSLGAGELRASSFDVLGKIVTQQVHEVIKEAQQGRQSAPARSAQQIIGDFYTSGTDLNLLKQQGSSPVKPELDKIAAIQNLNQLPELSAHLLTITNDLVFIGIGVSSDYQDRTRYATYIGDGELPLSLEMYEKAEYQRARDAYQQLIQDFFVLAGKSSEQARQAAQTVFAIESRIAKQKLTAVEARDPAKRFSKMSFADAQKLLTHFDLAAHAKALNLPTTGNVVLVGQKSLLERNTILKELPLQDNLSYLQWEVLRRASQYLGPDFYAKSMAFNQAVLGTTQAQTTSSEAIQDELVRTQMKTLLGHPLSRSYVDKYFSPATKQAVEQLIQSVRSEFRERLTQNSWLSANTRNYALTKLDQMQISVGYPTQWLDFSSVDIRPNDYLGNVYRINSHNFKRTLAQYNQPVQPDQFASAGSTLPIDVNAAYQPSYNKIEIPAAFLQPPFYNPKADVAVNYCAIGAVIGHEMTHGFDSRGRLYDAQGNLRNWWSEADAQYFVTETQKLVKQAKAYAYLPGEYLNGELEVTENLADVGGLTLAYNALQRHLAAHPEDNRSIDGLSPQQRCFATWAQLWAEKTNPTFLRQDVLTNPHPPGSYRVMNPAQHVNGFFNAYGIQSGDPMWLEPASRVNIW